MSNLNKFLSHVILVAKLCKPIKLLRFELNLLHHSILNNLKSLYLSGNLTTFKPTFELIIYIYYYRNFSINLSYIYNYSKD